MSQEQYDLIFSGELVPGFELAQVKKNIQLLFRIDAAKTEVLFSGREIQLKKGLDAQTANKYRVAIKKAGARVAVVDSAPTQQPQQEKQPQVERSQTPAQPATKSTFTTALGAQPEGQAQTRTAIAAPSYEVAAAGADLMPSEYRLPLVEVDVDISAYSIAPQEGPLISDEEHVRPQTQAVNVPQLEVAPAGSDVLAPHERKQEAAKPVDTSKLSVAEAGERLGPPAQPAPPAPNVEHIHLHRE